MGREPSKLTNRGRIESPAPTKAMTGGGFGGGHVEGGMKEAGGLGGKREINYKYYKSIRRCS